MSASKECGWLEAGGRGGFGFEGGDGFDETRDGQGVADTAGAANEVEPTTMASQGDREFDERGDAGAVDLRNVVEIDDHLAGAFLKELLSEIVEVLTGLPDGEAALDVEIMDTTGLARVDFKWRMKRHERFLSSKSRTAGLVAAAWAAPALYDEEYEEQVAGDKAAQVEGVDRGSARDTRETAGIVGGRGPAGKDSDGGGAGRGVCVDRIAGA